MREIEFSADDLVEALLKISADAPVCLFDSCGARHSGAHLLIAGVNPIETFQIDDKDANETLRFLDEKLAQPDSACIFTISYDFGLKLENIEPRPKEFANSGEPDVFLARFDSLIVHDYDENKTYLTGDASKFGAIERLLAEYSAKPADAPNLEKSVITSNFKRSEYLAAIERIKEFIRGGETYQTNLTQQIRARLPENLTAPEIFRRLRTNHPAPFAAFIKRDADFVISISPERFFKVESGKWKMENGETKDKAFISVSPIKGTRPRGGNDEEDARLKNELLQSEKDRAENVMIVDLLRNDIGRICKFGSVEVEKLCELETHPTLFHLVSTVNGELRDDAKFSDIIRAVFPCGSITGAPKIRTMQLIYEIETANRGLSMGAIGCSINGEQFKFQSSVSETYHLPLTTYHYLDLSVAIRTMIVRGREAIFNVGGGIVIDSVPEEEFEETLTKARALLAALNAGDWAENQTD